MNMTKIYPFFLQTKRTHMNMHLPSLASIHLSLSNNSSIVTYRLVYQKSANAPSGPIWKLQKVLAVRVTSDKCHHLHLITSLLFCCPEMA